MKLARDAQRRGFPSVFCEEKLNCRAFFLAEVCEGFALFREPLQQRGRPPRFTMLAVEFRDTLQNFFEANGVGIPHRTATMCGKTVAVQINDVDVGSTQSVTFFQNARTLVDERVDTAIRDFLGGDLPLHNSGLGNPFANEFIDSRVRDCPPLVIISIPTCAGFLPESAEL